MICILQNVSLSCCFIFSSKSQLCCHLWVVLFVWLFALDILANQSYEACKPSFLWMLTINGLAFSSEPLKDEEHLLFESFCVHATTPSVQNRDQLERNYKSSTPLCQVEVTVGTIWAPELFSWSNWVQTLLQTPFLLSPYTLESSFSLCHTVEHLFN